jgi:hypothetical protein
MHSLSLRRFAGIALTSLALATAACGGDDDGPSGPSAPAPAPAPADVSGTYDLTRLRALGNLGGGGNSLPVTFLGGGGATLTFNSGHLTLNSDGSYELEVEAVYNGGGVTMDDQGTYDVSGNSIGFTPTGSPARMKDGTISGSSMTAETQFGGIPFEIDLQK